MNELYTLTWQLQSSLWTENKKQGQTQRTLYAKTTGKNLNPRTWFIRRQMGCWKRGRVKATRWQEHYKICKSASATPAQREGEDIHTKQDHVFVTKDPTNKWFKMSIPRHKHFCFIHCWISSAYKSTGLAGGARRTGSMSIFWRNTSQPQSSPLSDESPSQETSLILATIFSNSQSGPCLSSLLWSCNKAVYI